MNYRLQLCLYTSFIFAPLDLKTKDSHNWLFPQEYLHTLFEVNGVRYASSPDYSSCGTYTVNGDTILLIDEDMGNDEMGAVRIDGDTLKLSKTENSNGWTNLVSGEHNWAAYQKLGVPSDYLD